MTPELNAPVKASWICAKLSKRLAGPDRDIRRICSLDAAAAEALSFVLPSRTVAPGWQGTLFGPAALASGAITVIASETARLDFIRAQYLLSETPGFVRRSAPPVIHPCARIGRFVDIEPGVEIGEGTRIGSFVVVRSGTRIGRHCRIKSGAVIGEEGFGFERDAQGRPMKMLHLGGVRIGDCVEIGSLSTVARGALGDTVLEDHVKLDDHVHVAHNCVIGERTMITACAELSGSVRVGSDCWLAPNCSIVQKLSIGRGAFVGIGAVVAREVPEGARVFGNPAKRITGG